MAGMIKRPASAGWGSSLPDKQKENYKKAKMEHHQAAAETKKAAQGNSISATDKAVKSELKAQDRVEDLRKHYQPE